MTRRTLLATVGAGAAAATPGLKSSRSPSRRRRARRPSWGPVCAAAGRRAGLCVKAAEQAVEAVQDVILRIRARSGRRPNCRWPREVARDPFARAEAARVAVVGVPARPADRLS